MNPHALTGTGTLSQRVCQFRHSDVATRETRMRSRSVARRRACATLQSRQRQRPWNEALEDQAVGDRGETEHQCSKHGDAIEIALNDGRAGGCRPCTATEHVGKPATFAAVQKHKKDQGERREDVQWGDEPNHGRQDTETSGPIGIPD